jgi:hypothetical protein
VSPTSAASTASHWFGDWPGQGQAWRRRAKPPASLHYEELIEQPIPTLEKVAPFAGRRRRRHENYSAPYPNRSEGWREHIPPDVCGHMQIVQYGPLRRRGYVT